MRFSERYGHRKVREVIQIDAVDEPLKNSLWSIVKLSVWDHARTENGMYGGVFLSGTGNQAIRLLLERLWFDHFQKPLDELGNNWSTVYRELRNHFYGCAWYEVYDFIEFVANNYSRGGFRESFIGACNAASERELSAYRFVGTVVAPLTSLQEVEEVESALEGAQGPVQTHLHRALELVSDRQAPDYRNSIKESISAVESLVATIVGDKGTLGRLLKQLQLHPALCAAFGSLYGYTSDEGGIRHALLDEPTVGFEEARFFLVACSAFANYVQSKQA
jgi:hypothetical protein